MKHGPKTQESAFRVRGEKSKVAKFDKLVRKVVHTFLTSVYM